MQHSCFQKHCGGGNLSFTELVPGKTPLLPPAGVMTNFILIESP